MTGRKVLTIPRRSDWASVYDEIGVMTELMCFCCSDIVSSGLGIKQPHDDDRHPERAATLFSQ
jgi:hypothetical protein